MITKKGANFNMRMRKKKRGAQRLLALSSIICENPAEFDNNFKNLFDSERPLRLEIGCGKGDFICELSKRDNDFNYFAMEKVNDVIVVAAEKYATSRGLGGLSPHGDWQGPDGHIYENGETWDIPVEMRGNVRFIPGDAGDLTKMFAPATFDTIYANFSDPWTKNGQADRRLTAPGFLKIYNNLLKPGGKFIFKTDNIQLFEYSLETVQASELELVYHTFDLHNDEKNSTNIQTEYERNFSAKGFKINYLEARKVKPLAE